MVIIRDGKEIKLTMEELTAAYFERQTEFDKQDIKDNLHWILEWMDRLEIYEDLLNNKEFIDNTVQLFRHYRDNDDGYVNDLQAAIENTVKEMEEKRNESGR